MTVAACPTGRPAPSSQRRRSPKSSGAKTDLISVKALQLSVSNGTEASHNSWDGSYFMTTRKAAERAYREAGIEKPREEISMIEVHDCFSVTELVTMEDLYPLRGRPGPGSDVLDGFYNADGGVPCQIDGGLKCFGHPDRRFRACACSTKCTAQLLGRAGRASACRTRKLGLTHNLGGFPHQNIASVSIIGRFGH